MKKNIYEKYWETLFKLLSVSDLEIETYVLNNKPTVSFRVSEFGDKIRISETNRPNSCKLATPRVIDKDEFLKTAKYFEDWESGSLKRTYIAHDLKLRNVSYVFGIIHFLRNNTKC